MFHIANVANVDTDDYDLKVDLLHELKKQIVPQTCPETYSYWIPRNEKECKIPDPDTSPLPELEHDLNRTWQINA